MSPELNFLRPSHGRLPWAHALFIIRIHILIKYFIDLSLELHIRLFATFQMNTLLLPLCRCINLFIIFGIICNRTKITNFPFLILIYWLLMAIIIISSSIVDFLLAARVAWDSVWWHGLYFLVILEVSWILQKVFQINGVSDLSSVRFFIVGVVNEE